MSDEMWNSVTIYGPQAEIERFKELCIVSASADDADGSTPAIDFDSIIPIPPDVQNEALWMSEAWGTLDPWNFRQYKPQRRGIYWFAFDTLGYFPIPIFERLAHLFSMLAFDCDCIADDDSSMGYGWFNTPPRGEDFHDGYSVPTDYWGDNGGIKRDPMEELRYRALIAQMERGLGDAEEEC